MKRLFTVLFLVLASFQSISPAQAALTGCPNTWPTPLRNQFFPGGMPSDLSALKKDRTFDVAITSLGEEYSLDGTTWIPAGDERSGYPEPLMYAFIGKQGRSAWKVEVRGCSETVIRYYGYDLERQKDPLEARDIKTFFNDPANREKFGGPKNFQEYSQFIDSFEKCKNDLVVNAKTYYSVNGSKPVWDRGFPNSSSCEYLNDNTNGLQLFFKDSSCFKFDNGLYRIANGTKCSAFIGFYYYPSFSLSVVNFISFSEISFEGPVDQTKSIQDRASAVARSKPGTPYVILMEKYTGLLNTMINSLWSKVRTNQELTPRFNSLKTRIFDSRDDIGKSISQAVPDSEVLKKLPQWELQYNQIEQEFREIEYLANQAKTIQCVKGKTIKTLMGRNPKCPVGYKKK